MYIIKWIFFVLKEFFISLKKIGDWVSDSVYEDWEDDDVVNDLAKWRDCGTEEVFIRAGGNENEYSKYIQNRGIPPRVRHYCRGELKKILDQEGEQQESQLINGCNKGGGDVKKDEDDLPPPVILP